MKQNLTLYELKNCAKSFANALSAKDLSELYGVTDGKAVGTFVEHAFHEFLQSRYEYVVGSSASGIDFPELEVDLK